MCVPSNVIFLAFLSIQVRFELTFFALNPELNVVAPWREWDITGREDAIEYAKKHNVPVPVTKKSIYSRDRNLWHLSHEVSPPHQLLPRKNCSC
jgi:argininosuccinate synthase